MSLDDATPCEGQEIKIVKLNIGGKRYEVSHSTLLLLEPDSFFNGLLQHGIPNQKDGYYFIDRGYELFDFILSWLRNGDVVLCDEDFTPSFLKKLKREAEYYCLQKFVSSIEVKIQEMKNMENNQKLINAHLREEEETHKQKMLRKEIKHQLRATSDPIPKHKKHYIKDDQYSNNDKNLFKII